MASTYAGSSYISSGNSSRVAWSAVRGNPDAFNAIMIQNDREAEMERYYRRTQTRPKYCKECRAWGEICSVCWSSEVRRQNRAFNSSASRYMR
jgi:hypothetical protein